MQSKIYLYDTNTNMINRNADLAIGISGLIAVLMAIAVMRPMIVPDTLFIRLTRSTGG
ncbi:MAG: hypothetical protein WA395_14635 [Nitrososphaeraceae archaeon]